MIRPQASPIQESIIALASLPVLPDLTIDVASADIDELRRARVALDAQLQRACELRRDLDDQSRRIYASWRKITTEIRQRASRAVMSVTKGDHHV